MTTKKFLNEMPPQKNVITLEAAESRTNFWREGIKSIYPDTKTDDLPRGFVIPFADLAQLVEDYKDQKIDGVRVYLTFSSARPEGGAVPNQITGILVPAKLDGDTYVDIIETVETIENKTHGVAVSARVYSIYDVTQPCPPCWDKNSPLF